VLAPGFQTFGEDYQIDKAEMLITVKLKRPGGQYSIYENHGTRRKLTTRGRRSRNRSDGARDGAGSTEIAYEKKCFRW